MNKNIPLLLFLLRFIFCSVIFFCATENASAQSIDFGKSYINVTKGLNGGTVETGDTLEIRASFVADFRVLFLPVLHILPIQFGYSPMKEKYTNNLQMQRATTPDGSPEVI
jgi:hypothetical protein